MYAMEIKISSLRKLPHRCLYPLALEPLEPLKIWVCCGDGPLGEIFRSLPCVFPVMAPPTKSPNPVALRFVMCQPMMPGRRCGVVLGMDNLF